MASTEKIRGVVGVFDDRDQANYALRALTELGGYDRDKISLVPLQENNKDDLARVQNFEELVEGGEARTGDIVVLYQGSSQAIARARAFLQESPLPEKNSDQTPQKSPYGLKRSRDLMAFDDFG